MGNLRNDQALSERLDGGRTENNSAQPEIPIAIRIHIIDLLGIGWRK